MSPVEDNLSYQLGLLTASIDSSRTDANRRFDSLVSSIQENKYELGKFKDHVQKEFDNVNQKFSVINQNTAKWQGVTLAVAALPGMLIFLIQVWNFLHK